MNTLESIVPPLELCRKIPEGKFADTPFVWHWEKSNAPDAWRFVIYRPQAGVNDICPAPTLEEILKEFDILTLAAAIEGDPHHRMDKDKQYASSIGGLCEYRNTHIFDPPRFCIPVPTTAAAALKVWMEMNKND